MVIQTMQKKVKYLDWLYKVDYNKELFLDIDELLKESINWANELYKSDFDLLLEESEIYLKDDENEWKSR